MAVWLLAETERTTVTVVAAIARLKKAKVPTVLSDSDERQGSDKIGRVVIDTIVTVALRTPSRIVYAYAISGYHRSAEVKPHSALRDDPVI
jgi:hypothetical protein